MSYASNFQDEPHTATHDDEYANLVYSAICNLDKEIAERAKLDTLEWAKEDGLTEEETEKEIKRLQRDAMHSCIDVFDEAQAIAECMESRKVGEVILATAEAKIAFDNMCGTLDDYERILYEAVRAVMLRTPTYEEWLAQNSTPDTQEEDQA